VAPGTGHGSLVGRFLADALTAVLTRDRGFRPKLRGPIRRGSSRTDTCANIRRVERAFACRDTATAVFYGAMPRKPEVPTIPDPPAKRSKPPSRLRARKAAPETPPEMPAMPDLWEAFGASWGLGEPVETAQPTPVKPRSRKGSSKR
jgi:hypothetical protein